MSTTRKDMDGAEMKLLPSNTYNLGTELVKQVACNISLSSIS